MPCPLSVGRRSGAEHRCAILLSGPRLIVSRRPAADSRLGTVILTAGSLLAATGVSGNLSRELALSLERLTVAGVVMVGLAWIILGIEVARGRRRPRAAAATHEQAQPA